MHYFNVVYSKALGTFIVLEPTMVFTQFQGNWHSGSWEDF